jgi:MFS transporter, SP family, arabinose:H+ symporter
LAEIKDAITHEQGSILLLFHGKTRHALIIGIALAILQQITGINVVMYYAPMISAKADSQVDSSLLQAVALRVVNLLFTLVAIWVIDTFGCRKLLLAGSSGMGVFLILIGLSMQSDVI